MDKDKRGSIDITVAPEDADVLAIETVFREFIDIPFSQESLEQYRKAMYKYHGYVGGGEATPGISLRAMSLRGKGAPLFTELGGGPEIANTGEVFGHLVTDDGTDYTRESPDTVY